jgi:hypothetical protein
MVRSGNSGGSEVIHKGPTRCSDGHPACRPRRFRRFWLDTEMRPVSNAYSGEPDEVPDSKVNAHLGISG